MSSQTPCIVQQNNQLQPKSQRQLLQGENRFELQRELADTLQGRIYVGIDKLNGNCVIVKEAWKQLVKLRKSRKDHYVFEDFINEKEVIKFLSKQMDFSFGIVRMIDEWEDRHCYFYAMEACNGGVLFDYIKSMHIRKFVPPHAYQQPNFPQEYVEKSNAWIKTVRHFFRQLVDSVSWMHNKGVCHLDLSLENTMIYEMSSQTIKIIDFGVAMKTEDGNFMQSKRIGKFSYMAPEVFAEQRYDSRKADIWSLGVMLFMMLIGAPLYELPTTNNPAFAFILNGRVGDILKHWNLSHCVTTEALDLMVKIFRVEKDRISMEDLRKHPFVELDSISLQHLIQDNNNINMCLENQHNRKTNENVDDNIDVDDNICDNNDGDEQIADNNNNVSNIIHQNMKDNHKNNNEINIDNSALDKHKNNRQTAKLHIEDTTNEILFQGRSDNNISIEHELNIQKYQFKSAEAINFKRRMLLLDNSNINVWNELAGAIAEMKTKKESQQRNKENVLFRQEGIEASLAVTIDELNILQKIVESKSSKLNNKESIKQNTESSHKRHQ